MKIKELIVRKTEPSEEIIRDIKFNLKGLSLIIDNTSEAEKESGNSVGKSTVIKIIDLCLGAKSVRELYYDSDTRSQNDEIAQFLKENKVQAELILLDEEGNPIVIKRDLYPRGKKYIGDVAYGETDFWNKLKKLIFDLDEDKPTFRQLIPKFVRLDNAAEDSMVKYLPQMTTNDDYDVVYCFLYKIYNGVLLNRRVGIQNRITECQKTIQALEKSKSIVSLSALKQSLEIVNSDLASLNEKRNALSYMDTYRHELDSKRQLSVRIKELQDNMQLLEFEISTIESSMAKLAREKKDVDYSTLRAIYEEAQSYIPDLQKSFEQMVEFHNSMIQNRIDFISAQLAAKKDLYQKYSEQLDVLLAEKEKCTIEALDEGLLDELNTLNRQIEDLTLQKGEIQQSIHLLEEQEQSKTSLTKELAEVEAKLEGDDVEEKIKKFNQIFSTYCETLYGEKYLLAYNEDWKAEKKFPISIASLGGNLGTGKKKAIIVAYDLAYMQYSIEAGIKAPRFVIHDKLESTHINQLKTIFELCKGIEGQYIIPILRERIGKVDESLISEATVLELSTSDKFFGV